MCGIDTTCIKKSIFKTIDKYCGFKNYETAMDLVDECTDYEDNNDKDDDNIKSEKQIADEKNNTDDNYSSSGEENYDHCKNNFKKDTSNNQNNNSELKNVDQLTISNNNMSNTKSIDPIFYDYLKDIKIILAKAITDNDKELMNNSLKAVTLLLTIISLGNTSNTGQQNNQTQNTNQENTSNTNQKNTSKTSQQNTQNTDRQNNHTQKTNKTFSTMLKKSKSVINPSVTDKESFQYSVTLSRHNEMGNKNLGRKSKIKEHLKYFTFKDINNPLEKEDYETFERNNNSVSLIVLKPNDENEKLHYHFNSGSVSNRQTKIYLLLLDNKYHAYVKKTEDFQKYIT